MRNFAVFALAIAGIFLTMNVSAQKVLTDSSGLMIIENKYPVFEQLKKKMGKNLAQDFLTVLDVWYRDSSVTYIDMGPLVKRGITKAVVNRGEHHFSSCIEKSDGSTFYCSLNASTPPWHGFLDERIALRQFARGFVAMHK